MHLIPAEGQADPNSSRQGLQVPDAYTQLPSWQWSAAQGQGGFVMTCQDAHSGRCRKLAVAKGKLSIQTGAQAKGGTPA